MFVCRKFFRADRELLTFREVCKLNSMLKQCDTFDGALQSVNTEMVSKAFWDELVGFPIVIIVKRQTKCFCFCSGLRAFNEKLAP